MKTQSGGRFVLHESPWGFISGTLYAIRAYALRSAYRIALHIRVNLPIVFRFLLFLFTLPVTWSYQQHMMVNSEDEEKVSEMEE